MPRGNTETTTSVQDCVFYLFFLIYLISAPFMQKRNLFAVMSDQ